LVVVCSASRSDAELDEALAAARLRRVQRLGATWLEAAGARDPG
jgi:hypothetical protein